MFNTYLFPNNSSHHFIYFIIIYLLNVGKSLATKVSLLGARPPAQALPVLPGRVDVDGVQAGGGDQELRAEEVIVRLNFLLEIGGHVLNLGVGLDRLLCMEQLSWTSTPATSVGCPPAPPDL